MEIYFWALSVFIGAAQLILGTVVFFLPNTLDQQRMVSTNLFDELYYRICMSVLIFLQLLMVALYISVFRRAEPLKAFVASLFVATALVGWTITVSCSPSTDLTNHSIGAGLFVAGTACYYIEVLWLAYKYDARPAVPYDALAALVFFAAAGFALAYVVLYWTGPGGAWLFENLALLVMALGYTVFFYWHHFDPAKPLRSTTRVVVDSGSQRAPLIAVA